MAQRYITDDGVLVIPGAYPSVKVQKTNSGIATSGVLFLVGEADAGAAWSQETDLATNFFAPTESSAVLSKYKSGNIVDAFRAAANPANDPDIVGSPSAIFVIKTNAGTKASANLVRSGLSNYGVLADKTYGKLGNLIYSSVTEKASEVGPNTGPFTYIPGPSLGGSDQATLAVRVNGGAKQTAASPAQTTPTAYVATLNGLSGVLATGGVDRTTLSSYISTDTLALAASGNNIVITGSVNWGTTPSVGDTLVIPLAGTFGVTDASVIVGAANANAGSYVVTAATVTTISATKLRDTTTTGVTAPVAVSAVAVGTEQKDILVYSPVRMQNVTGTDRGLLTGLVSKTVSGAASGTTLVLTLQTGSVWNALPQANDYVYIPSTAPAGIKGGSSQNVGWYRVAGATTGVSAGASTITMTSLNNTAPVTFGATAVAATTDIQCLRPAIDGTGKSLELYDNGDSLNINTQFYTTAGAAVAFLSTASTPYVLTSSVELSVTTNVSRQADGVSEVISSGGDVVLLVGYKGTTATLTIGATTLTTSVVGGSGGNLSITLADYKRVSDLAAFINAQTGYTCTVNTSTMGQYAPSTLDEGTYYVASDLGAKPGRIKKDAYDFFTQLSRGSSTVQLGTTTIVAANSGLPDAQSTTYLAGGTKGGTTAADFQAAVDALAKLRGNFVVPLFSRDATADIADGLTESSSTYTIDAIHAVVSSHVNAMSKLKTRRHRQGFLSYKGSFADAKTKAQNVANYRCGMPFQDFKAIGGDGTIQQFQPWMGAVFAAGMQAAGFYRSILAKGINCSGVLMADGSFTDQSNDDLEAAINNGLLAAVRREGGGIVWNSDQTTYAVDDNSFVFNSIQMVYDADIIALTVAQRMERAFVGQSVADVSASLALSYLKGIMSDIKRLKLVAASDDAPLGYRNPQITIAGNAMKVELEVKEAGAIMFIPISFLVTQVVQSAQ